MKSLEILLSIYDNRSVSKTADEFNLNQSTISYNLEKLRTIFNDKLFVVEGRSLMPTSGVEKLVPEIRHILQNYKNLFY